MSDRSPLAISVLDTMPVWEGLPASASLHNGLELAAAVERLGYRRYWVAEHHNTPSVASSSPAVLIGQLAARTSTLRVGSGGVMLPNHPPLVVAEQFATLASFFPGRIDLGIGRAPGTDGLTATALRRSTSPLSAQEFPQQLKELEHYLDGGRHPRTGGEIRVTPEVQDPPPVWLLGSSPSSAAFAGSRGLPFAFAHHLAPHASAEALRAYRESFTPSDHLAEPYAVVSAMVIAAESDEEAHFQAAPLRLAIVDGMADPFIRFTPPEHAARRTYAPVERELLHRLLDGQLIGGPETVRDGLARLVERTGADEVMGLTQVYDHGARVRSYEILADAVAALG
ncbi:luciferase family oxidoreductase, group 1 [Sinosporangium album]|uniref:Luciferase family oxidoreductase, group 1 n=1 Tax=Sinosporangium album TaxID=504805 RepID=A0A1G7YEE1_9ACTN|nr:LLM class flavin-dependent oxidoreductase [Sinosporangium album]SDG94705.1 luciferase family oxidoreductase, group 1 [Sinosporangium album]